MCVWGELLSEGLWPTSLEDGQGGAAEAVLPGVNLCGRRRIGGGKCELLREGLYKLLDRTDKEVLHERSSLLSSAKTQAREFPLMLEPLA